VRTRPNLEVRCRAFVNRVLFEGNRAVGVEVVERRRTHTVPAGEVILCGGAINSPQLLQLSGVGDARELGALGLNVVHDLPGVGENLQDHLEVYVQFASKLPVSVAPALKWRNRPSVGLQWLLFRSGPGATNHFESGGFIRSNDEVAYPNLMFHFLPVAIRYDGSAPQGHGYQVHVGPMYSDARGSVKVVSTDPGVHPALCFNYLSTDEDRREWVEAVRCARKILTQQAFDPFNDGEISPPARPSKPPSRFSTGWPRRGRAAPVLHVQDGDRAGRGRRPWDAERAWRRTIARGGCLGHAIRDERKHLRPGDDARREGRRPHPRQLATGALQRPVLSSPVVPPRISGRPRDREPVTKTRSALADRRLNAARRSESVRCATLRAITIGRDAGAGAVLVGAGGNQVGELADCD
jgi:GMC oxidoreductase